MFVHGGCCIRLTCILIFIREPKIAGKSFAIPERKTFQDPSGNFRLDPIRGIVNSGLFTCAMHCYLSVPCTKKMHALRERPS